MAQELQRGTRSFQEGGRCIHHLGCSNDFTGVYTCQNLLNYTIWACAVYYRSIIYQTIVKITLPPPIKLIHLFEI